MLLDQIGGTAPRLGEVGRLAALNAPASTLGSLVDYETADNDKATKGTIPRISDSFVSNERNLNDPFGGALDGSGVDMKSRVKSTALRLMSAEALDNNLDLKVEADKQKVDQTFYDRNADKAVGAITEGGKTYGGVAAKGGWGGDHYKVVVPNSIKKDDFFDVVGSLTDGELAKMPPMANGQPMTAKDLKDGRLVAVPDAKTGLVDGLYSLIRANSQGKEQIVTGQDGKPWTLDMKSYEPILRQRLPGSYRGGAQAPAPMPMPYRGVHGIETQEANAAGATPTE
jgi:hypothetical protein